MSATDLQEERRRLAGLLTVAKGNTLAPESRLREVRGELARRAALAKS